MTQSAIQFAPAIKGLLCRANLPHCIRDGHALAVKHLNLPQLRYNVFRFLSFSRHSLVLLKSGYSYPSGWTSFRGLFQDH